MRRVSNLATILAAVSLVLASCTGSDAASTTAASSATVPSTSATTVPTTTSTSSTTTTIAPALEPDALCDDLKIAAFDLDEGLAGVFGDITGVPEAEIDEEAFGRALLTEIVAFYERIGAIADEAPDEVADDLELVASVAEPLRDALDEPLGDTIPGLEAGDADPEVTAAAGRVADWVADACGSEMVFDPAEVVLTAVMGAMFGALGSAFGELGTLFEEGFAEGFDGGLEGPSPDALVYGDDPDLDALWDGCGLGDGDACEQLYFSAYGEYETFAQTCGGTVPFRAVYTVDCSAKLAVDGPSSFGDDVFLDELWEGCESGDDQACDTLYGYAPFDTDYEAFGLTCGDRREPSDLPCEFASSGEPFGYGDSATFDALWDACSIGDATACSDLYLETPFDSAYEQFGDACGDLVAAGRDCAFLAELLDGPVG